GASGRLGGLGRAGWGVGGGRFAVAPPRGGRAEGQQPESRFAPALSRSAGAASSLRALDYAAPAGAVRLERLVPDPALYPLEGYRRALETALREEGPALLDYGDPRGPHGLRPGLGERLAHVRIQAGPH